MTAVPEEMMTMVVAEPEVNGKVNGRNQILFQYYKVHPRITLSQLGGMFGISKQRASYLVKLQFRREYIDEEANRFTNNASSTCNLIEAYLVGSSL